MHVQSPQGLTQRCSDCARRVARRRTTASSPRRCELYHRKTTARICTTALLDSRWPPTRAGATRNRSRESLSITGKRRPTCHCVSASESIIYMAGDFLSSVGGGSITVVGYGTDKTKGDYWLIKNSWSENFANGGCEICRQCVSLDCVSLHSTQ